jgi:ribonuclease R
VLTGERRGLRFRLADPVRIEVLSVSVDERKIDFRIAGDENASDPAKRAGGRKPPSGKARKGGGRKGGGKPGRKGGKKRGGSR